MTDKLKRNYLPDRRTPNTDNIIRMKTRLVILSREVNGSL